MKALVTKGLVALMAVCLLGCVESVRTILVSPEEAERLHQREWNVLQEPAPAAEEGEADS